MDAMLKTLNEYFATSTAHDAHCTRVPHEDISNCCEYQRVSICVDKSINFKLILDAFD